MKFLEIVHYKAEKYFFGWNKDIWEHVTLKKTTYFQKTSSVFRN